MIPMLQRCRLCRNWFWTESPEWKDDQETMTGKPSICNDCDSTNLGTKPSTKSVVKANLKAYAKRTLEEIKIEREESKARIEKFKADAEKCKADTAFMKARTEKIRRSFK